MRSPRATEPLAALAELAQVIGTASGLDELVDSVLGALDGLFGFTHSLLLLYDDHAGELFTLASHGYDIQGIGSEVSLGVGVIGTAAARRAPMRVGNMRRRLAYARSVRRSAEEHGVALMPEIPLPGLDDAESQLAVPMLAGGSLIGVLAVETGQPLAQYDDVDEGILIVVGQMAAEAIVAERALTLDADRDAPGRSPLHARTRTPVGQHVKRTRMRYFPGDGSTFLDDAYLIRGVAGHLVWKLASEHLRTGRTDFTNREVRLDPDLGLPAYRDNFESRLTLLKRRLEERQAPIRILPAGRGRFRLDVDGRLELDHRLS